MSTRVRKITPSLLKNIILEEARKLRLEALETGITNPEKIKAEEVDADGFADTLEKDIDFIKALKIKEARLLSRLKALREAKGKLRAKISKSI
jgi:hypothetical protein